MKIYQTNPVSHNNWSEHNQLLFIINNSVVIKGEGKVFVSSPYYDDLIIHVKKKD